MKFSVAVATALCIASTAASASDLFDDEQPVSITAGTPIAPDTTIGGYPLFLADGKWHFIKNQAQVSDGRDGADAIKRGTVAMGQYEANGAMSAYMSVTVNLRYTGKNQYFGGKPCDGNHALTVIKSRGYDDNCAVVDFGIIANSSPKAGYMAIRAIQTSSGGRMYIMDLVMDPTTLGIAIDDTADWTPDAIAAAPDKREFMARVESWTNQLLNSTRKALDFNKPKDAFKDLPAYSTIAMPKSGTSASMGSSTAAPN
jgi:hypothetical protein